VIGRDGAEIVLDGTRVRFHTDTRTVYWASDWASCYDLARRGLLDRTFYPGYGDPVAQYDRFVVPAEPFDIAADWEERA